MAQGQEVSSHPGTNRAKGAVNVSSLYFGFVVMNDYCLTPFIKSKL